VIAQNYVHKIAKNNLIKKIDRHITYIDNKIDEFNKKLSEEDGDIKEQIKKNRETKPA